MLFLSFLSFPVLADWRGPQEYVDVLPIYPMKLLSRSVIPAVDFSPSFIENKVEVLCNCVFLFFLFYYYHFYDTCQSYALHREVVPCDSMAFLLHSSRQKKNLLTATKTRRKIMRNKIR